MRQSPSLTWFLLILDGVPYKPFKKRIALDFVSRVLLLECGVDPKRLRTLIIIDGTPGVG